MNPTHTNPLPNLNIRPRCMEHLPGTSLQCQLAEEHAGPHVCARIVWDRIPWPAAEPTPGNECGTAPGTDCATVSGVHPGMAVDSPGLPAVEERRKCRTKALESAINSLSMENLSDTPDFVLAEFLMASLEALSAAVIAREKWYSRQAGREVPFHHFIGHGVATSEPQTQKASTLEDCGGAIADSEPTRPVQLEPQRCNEVSRNLQPIMRCTRERGHCGEHQFRYGKADLDPKPDLEDKTPLLVQLEEAVRLRGHIRELEATVKALSVPLCIGREVLGILAREGQYLTDDGRGLVAADGLFRQDPYAQIDALMKDRALFVEIAESREKEVKSLRRNITEMEQERAALHAELASRIETIDKQDSYRKELKKGADYFRWLAHSVAGMIWRETQSQGPVNLGSPDAESGELMDRLGALIASLKKPKTPLEEGSIAGAYEAARICIAGFAHGEDKQNQAFIREAFRIIVREVFNREVPDDVPVRAPKVRPKPDPFSTDVILLREMWKKDIAQALHDRANQEMVDAAKASMADQPKQNPS